MKRPAMACDALPPRKYRHVVSQRLRGGEISHRAYYDGTNLGTFDTQEKAATCAAAAKGVPLKALLLGSAESSAPSGPSGPAAVPRSNFQGIFFHARHRRWQLRLGRSGPAKSFATEAEAKESAREQGLTLTPRSKAGRSDLGDFVARFRAWWSVYDGHIPGDLAAAFSVRKQYPALPWEAPLLYQVILRGKEEPWAEAVLAAYKKDLSGMGATAVCVLSSAVDCEALPAARRIHAVLGAACRAMAGVDRAVWARNVARNVGFHSGWLPLMQEYKVLQPAPSSTKGLMLGQSGRRYSVTPFAAEVHLTLFRTANRIGLHLSSVELPHTVAGWRSTVQCLMQELTTRGWRLPGAIPLRKSAGSAASAQSGYHWLWYMRTHLLAEMRANGINALQLGTGTSCEDLAAAFPDQGRWLRALGGRYKTLSAALDACQHSGPVELFSMYCCLFADKKVSACPAGYVADHVAAFQRELAAYVGEHWQSPHPAILLQLVHACG
jgi:hypothetical protein